MPRPYRGVQKARDLPQAGGRGRERARDRRWVRSPVCVRLSFHGPRAGKSRAPGACGRGQVGFGFYPRGYKPEHRIISTRLFAGLPSAGGRQNELAIPPGADNVRHDGYRILPRPTKLISFQAHMHYRGKAMLL